MVRLINKNNLFILEGVANTFLSIEKHLVNFKSLNVPSNDSFVYVMWHENQFCVYGIPDKSKVNILISRSMDGQIVSSVAKSFGFKTCRGSSNKKGSVSSTLHMIDCLKSGESVAIMVDGPRGPYHEVKPGAAVLARESSRPIMPITWYSDDKTFFKIPSWDKMACPFGPCKILCLFGEPIYPEGKTDDEICKAIKDSLLKLDTIVAEKYKEVCEKKLWKQKQ